MTTPPPPRDQDAADAQPPRSDETEPAPAASSVGSKRLKKRRRRCDCATADACFACGRCMEQHCLCGGAARRAVAARLCRQSRACNCRVASTEMRCALCMGCRQPRGAYSHCRCVQHQEHQQQQARDGKKVAGEGQSGCKCFHSAGSSTSEPTERKKQLRAIQRRAGIPSAQGVFANKISAASIGVDDLGVSCDDMSDMDDDFAPLLVQPTGVEEVEETVHPLLIRRSRPRKDAPESQLPLEWSRSKPYQESISSKLPHMRGLLSGLATLADKVPERISRGVMDRILENAVFEQERSAALPSEVLVDYLIATASVKASRMPELIGTFEDTAATALGIVVEEYMKQLVTRSSIQPTFIATQKSLQSFTAMVLRDFNYAVYLRERKYPTFEQLSSEQTQAVVDELTQFVLEEFVAVQSHPDPQQSVPAAEVDKLRGFIRAVVTAEVDSTKLQIPINSKLPSTPVEDGLQHQPNVKGVQLSQHTSKLTGQLVYKYEVAASIGGKHRAKVALDGFETEESARLSMKRMGVVLKHQDERLMSIENPAPPPTVEDPVISELYEQLLNQVKQARAADSSPAEAK